MYYVYVIQSRKDKRFYTGFTGDLQNRFREHNAGRVASTRGRGPFELIYYEGCLNEQDALAREKYLKSGMGKRYLKSRLKRFLSPTGQVEEPHRTYKASKGSKRHIIAVIFMMFASGSISALRNASAYAKAPADRDCACLSVGRDCGIPNPRLEIQ